ncbi:MAG: hypothetical protein WC536_00165 [Patescibacteria group bacterium]
MLIKPNKPVLNSDLHSCIELTANQVNVSDIKERALAEGYREQTSRHITILSGSKVREIIEHTSLDKKVLNKKILSLLLKFDWEYKEKDLFHIEKSGYWDGSDILENRESYIRTIEMPSIKLLYKKISEKLGKNIPSQFPHITLFTRGERENFKYQGIAIPSEEDFLKLKPIKIVE